MTDYARDQVIPAVRCTRLDGLEPGRAPRTLAVERHRAPARLIPQMEAEPAVAEGGRKCVWSPADR
ncbi:hypothetical protein ACPA9J_35055 [Pseudomonas aeruginosa]